MKVIATKDSKRLIKGMEYEIEYLHNIFPCSRVIIKSKGSYSANSFTLTDGSPLPAISWRLSNEERGKFNPDDLIEGDVLVCISDRYSHFNSGHKYKISHIKRKPVAYGYGGSTNITSVKFEGYNRYIRIYGSASSFRKLRKDESREMQISSIFDSNTESLSVDMNLKKIDIVDNIDVSLIHCIAKSIEDKSRHHLSIIDWACQKSSKNMGVNPEDFNHLLKIPLGDIIKMIDSFN